MNDTIYTVGGWLHHPEVQKIRVTKETEKQIIGVTDCNGCGIERRIKKLDMFGERALGKHYFLTPQTATAFAVRHLSEQKAEIEASIRRLTESANAAL